MRHGDFAPPNTTQEQTGGCCRGSAPPAPRAIRKPRVSGASEDFVPPAAQRRLVRRMEKRQPG